MRPRAFAALLATVLAAGVIAAQAPTFRTGVDVVIVEGTVLDKAGAVVRDLEPGDFSIEVDGKARECRGGAPLCPPDIRDQSRQMVFDAWSQVMPVLNVLRTVVRDLAAIPGSKHAVLISAGWMVSEREAIPEMSAIATEAARTNVTLHTFTAEHVAQTASRSRPSPTPFLDQQLVLSTVEALSGMTGGRAVRLTGSYDGAFAGLNAALSGYYRLGVRALPEDLDGKDHKISLKVRRRGASLSSYRRVLVAPASAPSTPVDPAVALRKAIAEGVTLTTLGLRVTSYVLHGTNGTQDLRVVVAGEVSRAVTGKATVVAALYQRDGTPLVAREATIDVASDGTAPLSISLDAPPGSYGLRLAVRDSEGRLGSLERLVEPRWQKAGAIETPGLVLLRTAPGEPPTPVFDGVDGRDEISVQLALNGASRQARVEIEITALGGNAPLIHRVPHVRETTSGQAVVHETLPASLLPPGRYTVSAKVSGGDAAFTRSFTVRRARSPRRRHRAALA